MPLLGYLARVKKRSEGVSEGNLLDLEKITLEQETVKFLVCAMDIDMGKCGLPNWEERG